MHGSDSANAQQKENRHQEELFLSTLASISAVLGIAMSSAILISSPSLAKQMKFKANMSASQVVSPNDGAGKGNAHITFCSTA